MRIWRAKNGLTLVEVMLAVGISVIFFASAIAAYLGVGALNAVAKHHIQAMEVVRGKVEALKKTVYANINNSTQTVSLDAGRDGVFGTADDVQGTLTVAVQDFLDYDGDGNTTENRISVDSYGPGGTNEDVAKPVRVTMTWTQKLLGQNRNLSVSVDTLIAA